MERRWRSEERARADHGLRLSPLWNGADGSRRRSARRDGWARPRSRSARALRRRREPHADDPELEHQRADAHDRRALRRLAPLGGVTKTKKPEPKWPGLRGFERSLSA